MSILNQIIGTLMVATLSFNLGVVFTWPSGTISMFASNDTRLDRIMTATELNLLGSLSSLAPLVSTPILGFTMDVVGRRNICIACSILPVIGWALIAAMDKVEIVLTSMFVGGLGGGIIVVVPIYIGEICQQSIRGTMTTCTIIFYSIGMMASYILAGLEYKIAIYINLSMAVMGVIGVVAIVRESPVYLMKKGFQEEAIKTIAYYRKVKIDSKEVLSELANIRRLLNPDIPLQNLSSEQEKLNQEHETESKKKGSCWQFFKKSPSTRRGFVVAIVMMTAIMQGIAALQVYGEPIFTKAAPNMSPKLGTVLMALIAIVSGVAAGFLTDILGRKPLMAYASAAVGVVSVILGTQLQFEWAPQWVTVVLLYLYTIVFTLGAGTVPYVLLSELFLPEVSGMMSMIVIQYAWIVTFVCVFIYLPCEIYLGPGRVFYLFAGFAFSTASFSIFFLPETKGLTIDAIQVLLVSGKRKNMNSS